ncbi:MAG: putative PEP-binding protein [Holosporales bacterium]
MNSQKVRPSQSYQQAESRFAELFNAIETKHLSPDEAILKINEIDIEFMNKPSVPTDQQNLQLISKGEAITTGAASGRVYFNLKEAKEALRRGENVILFREKLTNDDLAIFSQIAGVVSSKEDPSTHAAIVIKVLDKPFVTHLTVTSLDDDGADFNGIALKNGDEVTIDSFNACFYKGGTSLIQPVSTPAYKALMEKITQRCPLDLHGNSDTPEEAVIALHYGATGVEPRTEHMFFQPEKLALFRKVIFGRSGRHIEQSLEELVQLQAEDFYQLFKVVNGLPLVVRLLDPPLHEFVPTDEATLDELASGIGIARAELDAQLRHLHETNPMMGKRGARLLITRPDITKAQATAMFRAMKRAQSEALSVNLKINIPMVSEVQEILFIKKIIQEACDAESKQQKPHYQVGIMIETPRAALLAAEIAPHVDFISYGTNDLTAQTFAFSRGDVYEKFLNTYFDLGILKADPFITLDEAVKKLITLSVQDLKKHNPKVHVGLCGEQGSNAESAVFLYETGLDSISCNPAAIPRIKLALAKKYIQNQRTPKAQRKAA